MVFKFTVSNPSTRKSYKIEADSSKVVGLLGKKIGDEFDGDLLGLPGYALKITGGTDKSGFPMHPNVKGAVKKRVILTAPPGFHPTIKGQRKRKTVRGNTISDDIVQINAAVVKAGEKTLDELAPLKPKEKKEEVKEEKKEEPKVEKKEEKPEKKPEEKGGEESKKEG